MRVRVMSDLHLEFGMMDPGEGDILVLAGDICVASDYEKFHEFFVKCVKNYNRVFYVMGNHEHYHGDFTQTESILRNKLPLGVTLLNNSSHCVDGVHFVGATLWTNMNNLNVDTMEEARSYMNDYHLVENFTPEQSVDEHLQTREWLERCLPMLRGPVFMITHHAPSPQSIHGRYLESTPMYSSEMESFIKKYPHIKYWAHGHCHHTNDYMIGECNVIANPRGYATVEENKKFNPEFEIELTTPSKPVIV